jgi:DNA-binding SARP family transcriptional activator/nucleoid-associated protein YgaU
MPRLDAITQAARSGISDEFIVNTLAVVAWIAWAQLALALVAEIVSVVRGIETVRLPLLPGVQAIASHLVGGTLMLSAAVQPAGATLLPPIPAIATVSAEALAYSAAPPPLVHAGSVTTTTSTISAGKSDRSTSPQRVTVQRHDSYWAIAERTLGDGLRWREIHDLNVGRTLADGSRITSGDDTLCAGWDLLIPGDGIADTDSGGSDQGGHGTVVVETGDNLWDLSAAQLEAELGHEPSDAETAPYWRDVIEVNRGRLADADEPDLLFPGQTVSLPSFGMTPSAATDDEDISEASELPAEVPVTEPVEGDAIHGHEESHVAGDGAETAPTTAPITAATPTTVAATTQPSVTEAPSSSSTTDATPSSANASTPEAGRDDSASGEPSGVPWAIGLGGLSSVLLALGLARRVVRRRRRVANDHPGEMAQPTPPALRDLHQSAIAQADEDHAHHLQRIVSDLARSLASVGSERRPRLIRRGSRSTEVVVDRPDANAPTGWRSSADGSIWSFDGGPLADAVVGHCPAPLLVTVGQPEDDAQLYLDLEADGLTALLGDVGTAKGVARSILTELALSPLVDTLRVIAVGDLAADAEGVFEHLTVAATWASIADDLVAWATQSSESLASQLSATTLAARSDDPDHDAFTPIAVIADSPPPEDLVATLRAASPSAVAIVTVGDFPGAVGRIHCELEALTFDRINLACTPQVLLGDELSQMAELLASACAPMAESDADDWLLPEVGKGRADSDPDAASDIDGGTGDSAEDGEVIQGTPVADADEPPEYDILVRLLGEIRVEGGKDLKPKATAVVAYLALHRSVTTDRLEEACWFGSDGVSHRKRLRDTMTECRDALGSQHLPANRAGAYVAGPRVVTDIDLFNWHVDQASRLDTQDSAKQFRSALDLVSGMPFTYTNAARASFGWVDFEHHATTWEYRVVQVAQAFTELCIDLGQPEAAIALLRRLVQVIPLNSNLVESLMRAHISADDCGGAGRVYDEHAKSLEQAGLGEPDERLERVRLALLEA